MNRLTNVYKLLSDSTRIRILMLLLKEDLCVCELGGILEVPQPRISKNLSRMRDLGVVSDDRREKYVFYALNRDDALLIQTLRLIEEDLESTPLLVQDRNRLAGKETYLKLCQGSLANF